MKVATQRYLPIPTRILALLVALLLGVAAGPWAPSARAGGAATSTGSAGLTAEQLLPLTVSEAWERSGRDQDRFARMVRTLVAYSLDKRGLGIPNTREAGQAIGKTIRRRAEADRDQLLYAVVDEAVRSYAKTHRSTSAR